MRSAQVRYLRSVERSTVANTEPKSALACIVRILGNDLEPRHDPEQTINCLNFIIDHEQPRERVAKQFIVNRIFNREKELALVDLLEARGLAFQKIEFVAADYARQPLDFGSFGHDEYFQSEAYAKQKPHARAIAVLWALRHKINYAMNLNGARNLAIENGLVAANWVFPFDGQCFVPDVCVDQIVAHGARSKAMPYAIVPMRRVNSNGEALQPAPADGILEEPQIGFSSRASHWFDSERPYGVRDKADTLRALGYPGPWAQWHPRSFEADASVAFSQRYLYDAIQTPLVRLSSGRKRHDNQADNQPRYQARFQAILQTISMLDDTYSVPPERHSRIVVEQFLQC